ncbi:multiple sugar transport system substrate-binding protein [Gracilibacillus halotolerans]|uniref:Multiple sugar transport system substrate-binding protein n=1 Tax=Gracilibacillus halotolerans TaxID=74386 RepID=A0A841RPV1_9BACI|nr:ABC transporter substrate-binding protein [Gracilibacillus halotolerans]MBB6513205.1 multiple sugar transport system substrate-binding protein [Gracilibacillus halotolerans]
MIIIDKKIFYLALYIVIGLLLTACSKSAFIPIEQTPLANYKEKTENNTVEISEKKVLKVWTHDDILQGSLTAFSEKFPNVEVEIKEMGKSTLVSQYRSSLVMNKSPDIFVIPDEFLGSFSSINGFENLLDEYYDDPTYLDNRPEGLMKPYIDSQSQEMNIVPLLYFPYVMYYRVDILEELGYPSDPQDLAVYLNNTYNWLTMARDLKEKGYYITDTEVTFLDTLFRANYFMDEQNEYIGSSNEWLDIHKTAITIYDEQLDFGKTIWEQETQQALRDDELIMFIGASYMDHHLKGWAPEQEGKWAITTLPFELTAIDQYNSMSMAISSQSEDKMLAWEFVKHMTNDMLNIYTGIKQDPYFQNQNLQPVYWESLDSNMPGKPHVFDDDIKMIWDVTLKNLNWGEPFTMENVHRFHDDVKSRIKYEQQLLQEFDKAERE